MIDSAQSFLPNELTPNHGKNRSSVDTLAFVLENERLNRHGEFILGERDLFFASERWRELIVADLNVSIPVPARPP